MDKKLFFIFLLVFTSMASSFACSSYPSCHNSNDVHGCSGCKSTDVMSADLGD